MLAPTYTAIEYLWAFQRLLPRGRLWQRAWGTIQAEQLLTLMPTWARLGARANDLIVDAFPCTTTDLLPEWEASLGLPDPCTGPLGSIQERVAAVCAKFTARGGQSIAYFVAVCEALGYGVVTIDEFPPTSGSVPGPVYTWRVNIYTSTSTIWFRAGASTAGDPLASWGSNILECTLELLKPAHTTIIFAYYTSAPSLDLNFMLPGTLPAGVVFTRASTATYFDSTGTLRTAAAGAPRWDYNPATHALNGLLLEETRTNYALRSGTMSVSPWLVTGASLAANAVVAPDGTATATQIVEDTTNGGHYSGQNIISAIAVNAPITATVYVRANTRNLCVFALYDFTTTANRVQMPVNLTTGTLGAAFTAGAATAASYRVVNVGNGWWRLAVTVTLSAAATTGIIFRIFLSDTLNDTSYPGDGVSSIYVWGAQAEAGSFATSYIPTTAAAVTRAVDTCSVPVASIPSFSATQGSMQIEYILEGQIAGFGAPMTLLGANGNTDGIDVDQFTTVGLTGTTAQVVGAFVLVGGAAQMGAAYPQPLPVPVGTIVKSAAAWNATNINTAHNQTLATTLTPGTALPTVVTLGINAPFHYQGPSDMWVRHVRYWPRTLSNAELQTVTSVSV